ncbi:Cyclin-L1-1 [Pseudocercospora fuligena]|uniref:Cyclin-L1-1 n=1 Tax=Pseudocercospora fuligena TaxID=685502 RepID=A0A8H6RD21_9PEZI|nr:Cyclin-L1-1 [Pseudocercospora fuligena]
MAPITAPSHLLNPLVSSIQLETSASQLDGVPKVLEDAVRFETSRLIQAAGILLRLPQEIIAQAIVILQRYCSGAEGGSLLELNSTDVAAASLYLAAKPSATPVSPRQVLTSFAYLSSLEPGLILSNDTEDKLASSWHLSEGEYETGRTALYACEAHILRTLGFQTHVALPHTLCINYLQTLDVFQSGNGPLVAKRTFAHLNSALLSPQMLYLTHQPSALTTAAIYLAAKETGTKLPEVEWWEVFDVDREELGFLVVALRSIEGFASAEKQSWSGRKVPMSVKELKEEIEQR